MKRTENASAAPLRRAMHEAAGAPPQRTNGGCAAAQSTGAAALRGILQARPLALQVHGEPAIVDKSTVGAQWTIMSVAPCESTTAGRGCLLGRADPPCELQTRRRPTQLIPREAMPRVSHERGLFPSVQCFFRTLYISHCRLKLARESRWTSRAGVLRALAVGRRAPWPTRFLS